MENFVTNHVPTLRLLLVFLDSFGHDGGVIDGCDIGGRELPARVQRDDCINVVTDSGIPNLAALDGLTSNKGHGETGNQLVPSLDVLMGQARIFIQIHAFRPI